MKPIRKMPHVLNRLENLYCMMDYTSDEVAVQQLQANCNQLEEYIDEERGVM